MASQSFSLDSYEPEYEDGYRGNPGPSLLASPRPQSITAHSAGWVLPLRERPQANPAPKTSSPSVPTAFSPRRKSHIPLLTFPTLDSQRGLGRGLASVFPSIQRRVWPGWSLRPFLPVPWPSPCFALSERVIRAVSSGYSVAVGEFDGDLNTTGKKSI